MSGENHRPDSGMCLCLTDEQKEEAAAWRGNTTWCLQAALTEREKPSETNSRRLPIRTGVYFHWLCKQPFASCSGRRGVTAEGWGQWCRPAFICCPFNPFHWGDGDLRPIPQCTGHGARRGFTGRRTDAKHASWLHRKSSSLIMLLFTYWSALVLRTVSYFENFNFQPGLRPHVTHPPTKEFNKEYI